MANKAYTPTVYGSDAIENVQPLQTNADKLNHLAELEQDAVKNYDNVLDSADSPGVKEHFERIRDDHQRRGSKLSNIVVSMGGDPITKGKSKHAFQRAWADVKTAITEDDDKTALNVSAKYEEQLDAAYEDMLENGDIDNQDVYNTLARLHQDVHAGMERMQELARNHD